MEQTPPPAKRVAFQGPCYLKVLVNNLVAGAIIGKSGSVIAQIEQQTGCALKLSPANMYYPGTEERILIMSGEQEALNDAVIVVLEKIYEVQTQDGVRKDSFDTSPSQRTSPTHKIQIKIVAPKSAVAAIIGKGGQQIKDLQSTTNARVQVSSREEALVERLITVSGLFDEAKAAVLAIASCLQSDPNLKAHMYVVYKTPGPIPVCYAGGPLGYPSPLGACATPHHHGAEIMNQQCEVSIKVPEPVVGALIGKSGRHVSEMMKQTGARVQISQKGDFVPGTTNRKIVISGSVGAVHNAHILLLQRIHYATEATAHAEAIANGNGVDVNQAAHPVIQGGMQYIHPTNFGY